MRPNALDPEVPLACIIRRPFSDSSRLRVAASSHKGRTPREGVPPKRDRLARTSKNITSASRVRAYIPSLPPVKMVARNAEISRPTTRTGHVSNDTGWWTQELHQRHLSRPILPGPSVDLKGLKAVPEGPPALPGFTATTRWSAPVPHNRYSIPHGDRRSRRSLSTPTRPQQSSAAAAVTSRATGSHVPCKSPSRAHATSMPDTTWPNTTGPRQTHPRIIHPPWFRCHLT